MSNKYGIIVDGPGDFAALRARYKNQCKILKTDGPRSHTVSPVQIATSSIKQCKILKAFNCKKVIILTDFEKRRSNYQKFMDDLKNAFSTLNLL